MYSFKKSSLSIILLCNTAHMLGTTPTGNPQEQPTQAPRQESAPREPVARHRHLPNEYLAALMAELGQQIQNPAALNELVASLVVREHQPDQQ